jgi:phosphopantetheinyl transferase
MPFFLEIHPAEGIHAGIWHITETSGELLSQVNLSDSERTAFDTFRHDLRKRQWLGCRALLQHLLKPFPAAVIYDRNGKPGLDSGSRHISFSHAGDYAAAVVSSNKPAGIDIEKMKDRVERVKERFLHADELAAIGHENRLEQLYLYWCGKEALYKINGNPDVDFRNDIHIHPFDYLCHTDQICGATLSINGSASDYSLFVRTVGEYMLVVAY